MRFSNWKSKVYHYSTKLYTVEMMQKNSTWYSKKNLMWLPIQKAMSVGLCLIKSNAKVTPLSVQQQTANSPRKTYTRLIQSSTEHGWFRVQQKIHNSLPPVKFKNWMFPPVKKSSLNVAPRSDSHGQLIPPVDYSISRTLPTVLRWRSRWHLPLSVSK